MEKIMVGKAVKMAGVSADTIHYYQQRGLLPDGERLESGYRVYTAAEDRS